MNPELTKFISDRAEQIFEEVRTIREYLHQHPELSYQEFQTMAFVSKKLEEYGIPYTAKVGDTGVVGYISNGNDTYCIALRADLDALPIQEANEVPYKSLHHGVMHACGHDVHTSVLLGAAKILNEIKSELPHSVKLIFQPGEEKNPGGATYMIRDGVLQNPQVRSMYALHVFPELNVGEFGYKEGMYMASCDEIHLTINGKGGHAATPHACIDPISIGAGLITELQQVVSRKCDPKIPTVLSFGHFEALGATNVIPEKAHIKGTFRTMNEPWRNEALELITNIIQNYTSALGATVDLNISRGYPFLINDPDKTNKLAIRLKQHFGDDSVHELPIRLSSEDFSYYSQEVPVSFFRLGVRNEEKGITYGVHNPRFDIDPKALYFGIRAMCIAALEA